MNVTPRPKARALVSPSSAAQPAPVAEAFVSRQILEVTLALPSLEPADADVVVTRNSVRLSSRREPSQNHYIVPLPVAVEPSRFVLRHRNGVYDFTLQRACK